MILDIIILIIVLICLIWGAYHGPFGEFVSILGFCAGIYAALNYYYIGSILLSPLIEDNTIPRFLSMMIIFAEVYLILHIIGLIIKNLFRTQPLRQYHRVIGATLGAVRGIIVVSVAFIFLTAALPKNSVTLKKSILSEPLTTVSGPLTLLVTKEIKNQFDEKTSR